MAWSCSSLIGNPTSQEPTMFWILKSVNLTLKPQFLMIFAYFLAACFDNSQFLAPVQTIFPEAKMSAVVFGSLKRMITAAKRLGLYSAFLHCRAIFLRSKGHCKFKVDTTFLSKINVLNHRFHARINRNSRSLLNVLNLTSKLKKFIKINEKKF